MATYFSMTKCHYSYGNFAVSQSLKNSLTKKGATILLQKIANFFLLHNIMTNNTELLQPKIQ